MKRQIFLAAFIFLLFTGNAFSQTVYITKSGKKYHIEDCRYLSNSSIAIDLSEAVSRGYTPCKVCKPPSSGNYNPSSRQESFDNDNEKSYNENEEKVQCSATTKSGNRCKRMTKNPNGKCWQHD